MKNLVSLFLVLFSLRAFSANYTDMALELGVRQQSGDVTGANTDSQLGYQFGVTTAFPMADKVSFRTGFLYTEKSIKDSADNKYKFTYVEIPATVMFKFVDFAGAYAGVNLSMNLDHKCASVNCPGNQSFLTPLVIGAAFKFAPQLGADLYYESVSGKLATGVKDFKAVGVNLMVTFD